MNKFLKNKIVKTIIFFMGIDTIIRDIYSLYFNEISFYKAAFSGASTILLLGMYVYLLEEGEKGEKEKKEENE